MADSNEMEDACSRLEHNAPIIIPAERKAQPAKIRAGMIAKEGDKESPRILTTATGVMSSEGVPKRLKAIKLPTTNWRRFAPVAAS